MKSNSVLHLIREMFSKINWSKQLLPVIPIVILLFLSLYLGNLYGQRKILLSQQPCPQAISQKNTSQKYPLYPKYIGWLQSKESKNWSVHAEESKKTLKYHYKYPPNLYIASDVRRNWPQSAYFFPDQESYQFYTECVSKGAIPEEGERIARDWEGACDLKNLLFKISIHDGGERLTFTEQGVYDVDKFEKYQTTEDIIWTIPTEDGYFGGMGDSTNIEADTVYNNHTINLNLYFPNRDAITKTKELTGLDIQKLLKQIIVSFQIDST